METLSSPPPGARRRKTVKRVRLAVDYGRRKSAYRIQFNSFG